MDPFTFRSPREHRLFAILLQHSVIESCSTSLHGPSQKTSCLFHMKALKGEPIYEVTWEQHHDSRHRHIVYWRLWHCAATSTRAWTSGRATKLECLDSSRHRRAHCSRCSCCSRRPGLGLRCHTRIPAHRTN